MKEKVEVSKYHIGGQLLIRYDRSPWFEEYARGLICKSPLIDNE